MKLEILAKCKLIQPSYTPIVDVAQYKGKNILVVWCFGGQTRPYKCPTTLFERTKIDRGEKYWYS